MKRLRTYLNEKGQDLVEYTLTIAFCAALLMGLNSDAFNNSMKAVFESDANIYDDVSTSLSIGNIYKDAVERWSQNSRRTLVQINYENGKYVLGEDVIANEERKEIDRQALYNIADFFLGMDLSTIKTDVFKNELGGGYFKEGSYGTDILLMSYYDYVDDVESSYDPVTQQYTTPVKTEIVTERKGNVNGVLQYLYANEVIHWMQGDYGSYKDPNNSYDAALDFDSTKRYLFSNEMITSDTSKSKGSIKRNVRVNFQLTNGVVTGVKVRLQQNGTNITDLMIEKTSG